MRWLGNLVFPAVLIGALIASAYMQPPLISSPEVSEDFVTKGSQAGYFANAKEEDKIDWPADLAPLIKNALRAAFGPKMPQVESIYYFGRATRPWLAGLPMRYGAETILTRSGGRNAIRRFAMFGWPIRRIQVGRNETKSWRLINGDAEPADPVAAARAMWLERAALLLPLAESGLKWAPDGPAGLKASIDGAGVMVLKFADSRLVSARLGDQELNPVEPIAFGPYTLPSRWLGRWGQDRIVRFDLEGIVFNPPFAAQAMAVEDAG